MPVDRERRYPDTVMADETSNLTPAEAPATVPTPAWQAHLPRMIAGGASLATFGLLLVAAWLEPSGSGTGTHQQLGLPACGFLAGTGLPCATCGMTTAFSHAADFNLAAAFATQPAGAVLAILTAMTAILTGYAAITGMVLTPIFQLIFRPATIVALVILLLLGWAYTLSDVLLGT
ncbi:DUF2752 domain-containing protein [Phycisphaerales bacterium AB-hyl4]|uniref:DUF2752 domain-containing protein n=1 Tax=Natronomicrosphaera hydrolytica TaxID=3242702 RepID=A0ABV4U943_9BACT